MPICQDEIKDIITELIDQAPNGKVAYEMVKEQFETNGVTYGIIFMDCSMPIMNGFESTYKIRQYIKSNNSKPPQPMIAALTGHVEMEYIDQAFSYQMDEVISKPANPDIIKQIFSQFIEVKK